MMATFRGWWRRMPWNYSPSRHMVDVADRALADAAKVTDKDAE